MLILQLLVPHGAVDLLGYVALAANIYVYYAKTMIPLRVAAIIASALFLIFFFIVGNPQTALLNAALLAINVYRLLEIRKLIGQTREAARGDIDIELLRPYMVKRRLSEGSTLFRIHDEADQLYYLTDGEIDLPEVGVRVMPGTLFGEMGLFSKAKERSSSAVALTEATVLVLTYQTFLALYYQNPGFGLHVMRLIMERLQRPVQESKPA